MQSRLVIVVMLAVVFVASGIFLRAIAAYAASPAARARRTRVDRPNPRISARDHRRRVIANAIVSTALIVGATLGFAPRLFAPGPVGAPRALAEAAAILAIYDFAYYLYHRFALHGWSVGRRIHAVHHAIRAPYANDSLYVHPAETAGGVALFLGAAALVGPVGVASFGIAFLVYSVVNIWIHSAVDLSIAPLRPLTALVRHHDVHHQSMRAGHYASVTPIWDFVFGTARGADVAAAVGGRSPEEAP